MDNEKGMTLVELMVAVVIISLALITMLDMFDLGINTTSKAEKETKAVQLAQQKIEEAKYLLNNGQPAAISRVPFPEPENEGYDYEVMVEDFTGLKEIKVVVYYENKNVVLVTKLGDQR
ncbi:MAG: type IV pilus modification PilV family protein [Bacillota bacterium]